MDNSLRFSVSDTGQGIVDDDLPHLFDRYYQSAEKKMTSPVGFGIGLSLSQELAQLLGGKISVSSTAGQGSTFVLNVPFHAVDLSSTEIPDFITVMPVEPPPLVAAEADPTFVETDTTVMVVEDNPEVTQFLRRLLEKHYRCVTFPNGREALDYLQGETIYPADLIITDLRMPVMDGYELVEILKSDDHLRWIPTIVLSASGSVDSRLKTLRMGVDDYVVKPFSPAEILVRIQNLLRNYRQRTHTEPTKSLQPQFADTPSHDQIWLQELEEICQRALKKRINLRMPYVARQIGLSDRQITRRLKQLTGMTGGQYLQEMRLQWARHLLEQRTYATIGEIAAACGFKSASYFTQLFTQRFGAKPSVYFQSA